MSFESLHGNSTLGQISAASLPPGNHERDFGTYSRMICDYAEPKGSIGIVGSIKGESPAGHVAAGLKGLLESLQITVDEARPLHWVDVGSGPALAQVEAHLFYQIQPLQTTAIDPYRYDLNMYFTRDDLATLREKNRDNQPVHTWQQAEAMNFRLKRPANLATSVYSIPYWERPLEGIVRVYNQLAPNGIMAIVTDSDYPWTAAIQGHEWPRQLGPMVYFFQALHRAGIEFATAGVEEVNWSNNAIDVSGLYIRRRAATKLALDATYCRPAPYPVTSDAANYYKAAVYDITPGQSPIKVVDVTPSGRLTCH